MKRLLFMVLVVILASCSNNGNAKTDDWRVMRVGTPSTYILPLKHGHTKGDIVVFEKIRYVLVDSVKY